jgi:excisionase family DNA binding protein
MIVVRQETRRELSTGKHREEVEGTRKQWQSCLMTSTGGQPRFLHLADVAEILNTSTAQVYALVRRGDLPAIKIGGRGQWRVESSELEAYIQRLYDETRSFVDQHPYVESGSLLADEPCVQPGEVRPQGGDPRAYVEASGPADRR